MVEIATSDVIFFFGAGASSSFGIPTMRQFVTDFEKYLDQSDGTQVKKEREVYIEIKDTLEQRLGSAVDLEAIFTVIDGILNYSPERLGLLSLYAATGFKEQFPTKQDIELYASLRRMFQTFIRSNCLIPADAFAHIKDVYQDFFNRFALELRSGDINHRGDYYYQNNWTIFTTNYDTCLECYWRQMARIGIDTGFEADELKAVRVLRSRRFLDESMVLKLLKLHGSVNWLIEDGSNEVIEEEMAGGRSHLGRTFAGEMMVYPIAEKELYLDPYISMLLRLNRELERKPVWVVVGYSFNDPIVREIFIRKSSGSKHIVFVHSHADEFYYKRLHIILKGQLSTVEAKFGAKESFRRVNYKILSKLVDNPKYSADDLPKARARILK